MKQWHNWQNIAYNQTNVLFMVSTPPHFIGLCINPFVTQSSRDLRDLGRPIKYEPRRSQDLIA